MSITSIQTEETSLIPSERIFVSVVICFCKCRANSDGASVYDVRFVLILSDMHLANKHPRKHSSGYLHFVLSLSYVRRANGTVSLQFVGAR
jgi:hypothetical protein